MNRNWSSTLLGWKTVETAQQILNNLALTLSSAFDMYKSMNPYFKWAHQTLLKNSTKSKVVPLSDFTSSQASSSIYLQGEKKNKHGTIRKVENLIVVRIHFLKKKSEIRYEQA